ncbi:ABC transporter ATP-binding protein [Deinococcus ficus]|nr:ABC transporter ATP-binding protein [Deinococcus ficus]
MTDLSLPAGMIDVRGLTQAYGDKRVLDDVNLSVAEHERCALVGRNGAGKSTLIHSLLGLLPVRQGRVTLRGIPAQQHAWKKHVAYLPEKFQLYPNMTGTENLHFFSQVTGHALNEDRADEVLHAVHLQDDRDRLTGTYSKGMLQRLGLALMLYYDTEIIVLDEPTSGLDPIGREEILGIIRRLRGKTILMASHHFDEIRQVCTHVALLEGGRITKFTLADFTDHYFKGAAHL